MQTTPGTAMYEASLRILVVESDAANARQTRSVLEEGGHVIHMAANTSEAISRLNSTYFDLVLTGVNHPDMEGLETARAIRRTDDIIATIPIIALSPASAPRDDARCIKAGVNAFLSTPFSLPAFAETLRQVHNRRVFNSRP